MHIKGEENMLSYCGYQELEDDKNSWHIYKDT
jgi:hypothetical protein